MKKKLRRQLEKEHLYIDEMYNKWQRAAQRANQTGKEFGQYLKFIWSNLLDLEEDGTPNETQLIHRIRQGLRSKIRADLYRNLTVPKDWPIFLEAVARADSSIYLEHKTTSNAAKSSSHNKEKQADKFTDSNHSHGSSHKSEGTNARGNTKGQFCGCRSRKSLSNYRGSKVANNGKSASGSYSTKPSNFTDHSKDNCFICGKVGHLSNKFLAFTQKN